MARHRPSAARRGYGRAHRQLRDQWAPLVAAGAVTCWRCNHLIGPRDPWDLGHDDHDRTRYRGPEHIACNRATRTPDRAAPRPSAWWTTDQPEPAQRDIVLVAGPPCAGKTTYVEANAQPGDLVLDRDTLGATAYRRALDGLPHHHGRAWVIRSAPGPAYRAHVAATIGATRTELLLPPTHELLTRADSRPDPQRVRGAIRDWLRREREDSMPRSVTSGQAIDEPSPTVSAWWA